jgi:hypothetical protein
MNTIRFTPSQRINLYWASIAFIVCLSGCGGGVEPAKLTTSHIAAPPDSAQGKVDGIVENGAKSPVPPQTTTFSEDDVNQLLRSHMNEIMPDGISDPHVTLVGNGMVVARVVVDFDEYKRRRSRRGGLGPLALLTGKLPVTARGTLQTQEGQGRFRLEAAELNGIPLPPALVREMITALSRSRRNPEGYDIERPFPLPANIRTVTVNPQQAVVTQ